MGITIRQVRDASSRLADFLKRKRNEERQRQELRAWRKKVAGTTTVRKSRCQCAMCRQQRTA